MSENPKAADFWAEFCRSQNLVDIDEPYQVWYFGNSSEMARELADLVLAGRKTATASLAKTNEVEPEKAPILNGYSVVTDFDGEPLCVLQTTEIEHMRFIDVGDEFAAMEGEGDFSLEYWRRVHREYFEREAERHGFDFHDEMIVCCERFKVLYQR